ncbi:hypothetical protein J6590_091919 [Homalodisca vitripennis]|nr:hypothetical protein J6590_091919 [Homalodisca vitripennis]
MKMPIIFDFDEDELESLLATIPMRIQLMNQKQPDGFPQDLKESLDLRRLNYPLIQHQDSATQDHARSSFNCRSISLPRLQTLFRDVADASYFPLLSCIKNSPPDLLWRLAFLVRLSFVNKSASSLSVTGCTNILPAVHLFREEEHLIYNQGVESWNSVTNIRTRFNL